MQPRNEKVGRDFSRQTHPSIPSLSYGMCEPQMCFESRLARRAHELLMLYVISVSEFSRATLDCATTTECLIAKPCYYPTRRSASRSRSLTLRFGPRKPRKVGVPHYISGGFHRHIFHGLKIYLTLSWICAAIAQFSNTRYHNVDSTGIM